METSTLHTIRSARVMAGPDAVWEVLSALDQISSWAEDVDHSALTTSATGGVGAARRVQVGRLALIETVTIWEPDRELAYTIDGLPPVVRSVVNHWRLEPDGAATLVTLTTSIDPGRTLKGRIGAKVMRLALGRASGRLIDGLAGRRWTPTP